MIQVTNTSVRVVVKQGDDYIYKDSGQKVENTKRLGLNLAIFSASLPQSKTHNQKGLDGISDRMEKLKQQAIANTK
ncbi:MAG: hypothetical protein HC932_01045 [Thermales bacterium]|nr:hypothetical protein [Thermales bacterium]